MPSMTFNSKSHNYPKLGGGGQESLLQQAKFYKAPIAPDRKKRMSTAKSTSIASGGLKKLYTW